MKSNAVAKLLQKELQSSAKAAEWLRKSITKCENVSFSKPLSEPEFDKLENLTSRFARHSDILTHKVFRLIDQLELESAGSTLDILNRAAKRGLVKSDSLLRKIRETRNAIAHDYTEEELIVLFKTVNELAPHLLDVQQATEKYCERFLPK